MGRGLPFWLFWGVGSRSDSKAGAQNQRGHVVVMVVWWRAVVWVVWRSVGGVVAWWRDDVVAWWCGGVVLHG